MGVTCPVRVRHRCKVEKVKRAGGGGGGGRVVLFGPWEDVGNLANYREVILLWQREEGATRVDRGGDVGVFVGEGWGHENVIEAGEGAAVGRSVSIATTILFVDAIGIY